MGIRELQQRVNNFSLCTSVLYSVSWQVRQMSQNPGYTGLVHFQSYTSTQ